MVAHEIIRKIAKQRQRRRPGMRAEVTPDVLQRGSWPKFMRPALAGRASSYRLKGKKSAAEGAGRGRLRTPHGLQFLPYASQRATKEAMFGVAAEALRGASIASREIDKQRQAVSAENIRRQERYELRMVLWRKARRRRIQWI